LFNSAEDAAVGVTVGILSDGTFLLSDSGGNTNLDWSTNAPAETGGDFEVRWDLFSGDPPNSTPVAEATWISLSSDRYWDIVASSVGTYIYGTIDITIRPTGDAACEVTRQIGYGVSNTFPA
jgi:hypothetical protein